MEEILASIRRIIADDQAFVQAGVSPPPAAPPTYQVKEPPRFRTEPQPPSFPPPNNFAPNNFEPSGFAPPPNREAPARTPYTPPPSYEDYLAQARPAPAAPNVRPPPPQAPTPVHYPIDGQFQSYKTAAYAPLPDPASFAAPRDLPPPPPPMAAAEPFASRPLDPRAVEPSPAELRPAQSPGLRPAEVPPLVSPQTDAAVSSAFGALIASQKLPSDEEITGMVREMLRPMLKSWLDDNLPVLVERLVRMEIERVARGH